MEGAGVIFMLERERHIYEKKGAFCWEGGMMIQVGIYVGWSDLLLEERGL